MGFACSIGEPMTYKVIQCNTDPLKRNMVVHRGGIILHTLSSTEYNSLLVPKIGAYLTEVQL